MNIDPKVVELFKEYHKQAIKRKLVKFCKVLQKHGLEVI